MSGRGAGNTVDARNATGPVPIAVFGLVGMDRFTGFPCYQIAQSNTMSLNAWPLLVIAAITLIALIIGGVMRWVAVIREVRRMEDDKS